MMDNKMKNRFTRPLAMLLVIVLAATIITTSLAEHLELSSGDALDRIYSMITGSIGDPETSEDYYDLANVAIGQKNYEKALEYLETARSLADPEDTVSLGDMWLKTASIYALTGDLEAAMEGLNTALENDPASQQALLLRAQIYLQNTMFEEAAKDLQAYIELAPQDVTNGISLAQIYEQLGRYAEAEALYESFAQVEPENDSHHLNAIRCGFLNGEYEQSLAAFDEYLANADAESEYRSIAIFLKAACLMQLERYDDAVNAFAEAMDNGYDPATCYEQMVLCSFENDDFETAVSKGEEMLAKEFVPASADVFYQRMGASMMQLGRYEEAVAYLDQSIEKNPDLLGSHYYRGVTLLALSRCEEAAADFTKSIEQNFLLQFCYYNRGVCYVQLLDYDKALDDFGMTLTAGDDEELIQAAKDTLWQLAAYYENQAALTEQPEAVEADPAAIAEDKAVDVEK